MLGFRKNSVTVGEETFTYVESGDPSRDRPSLLLLHGFSMDKYSWGPFVMNLPADTHAIAMDLPGHGGSHKPDFTNYEFGDFAKAVDKFVEAVFAVGHSLHVIGQSMGGTVGGDYAATRPDRVAALTLVCPAMKTPINSELRQIYEETGKSQWFPETLDEFKTMQTFCYYAPGSDIMDAILVEVLDMMKAKYPYNKQLYSLVISDSTRTLLERRAKEIRMPVLVVWGENDKASHMSGGAKLKELLPDCRVIVYPECGHVVNKDKTKELVQSVVTFQEEVVAKYASANAI